MSHQINQQSSDNKGTIIGKINLDSKDSALSINMIVSEGIPCKKSTCDAIIHTDKAKKRKGYCAHCFDQNIKREATTILTKGFIRTVLATVVIFLIYIIHFFYLGITQKPLDDLTINTMILVVCIEIIIGTTFSYRRSNQFIQSSEPSDLTSEEIRKITSTY